MPLYPYKCTLGCITERWLTLAQHAEVQTCDHHGYVMEQIIQAPLLVKVAADVAYDSPIDGRHITSWQARQEDLKRNNCVPYDPDQKQDMTRKQQEAQEQLEKSVDVTVESAIEKMDTRTRGKLYSELTDQHMVADVVRNTLS